MDIISQFPDDLLVRILSFIPTKNVILSRVFCPEDGDLFGPWAPVLERLELRIYNFGHECHVADFGIWIGIAVSRRVRELEFAISFAQRVSISLPSSLCTCETLESLILNTYNCVLVDVPFAVSLPSLRKLHLRVTDYADNASLHRLLSGCPNLEDLALARHYDGKDLIRHADHAMDFTIVVPSLKRLSVIDRTLGEGSGYVIHAPSLTYLRVTDNLLYNFRRIETMPELVIASVELTNGVTKKFLKALTCARRLCLFLTLSEVMNPSEMIFHQLVELTLSTCAQGWWDLLIHMLQDSPKLQILRLTNDKVHQLRYGLQVRYSLETPNCWKRPSCVPVCLLNGLRDFKWVGYKGRQGDREVATYVLTNATRLKTATFTLESTDHKEKNRMLKELASVPTPSPSSQILFD